MRMARFSAALTGLVLVAAACGAGDESGSSAPGVGTEAAVEAPPATDTARPADATATDPAESPAEPAAEPEGAADPVVAPAALQFTAPLVGGGELDAAALAGKPTIFWFWAPT